MEIKQINLAGENITLNDEIARQKINALETKIDNTPITNLKYISDSETILVKSSDK